MQCLQLVKYVNGPTVIRREGDIEAYYVKMIIQEIITLLLYRKQKYKIVITSPDFYRYEVISEIASSSRNGIPRNDVHAL